MHTSKVAGITFLTMMVTGLLFTLSAMAEKIPLHIVVDRDTTHQTIDGFGASDCWTMQTIGTWSESNKKRVAELLFSPETGIGLSMWRFNLGGGLDDPDAKSWGGRRAQCFEVSEGIYDWDKQAAEQYFLFAALDYGVKEFVAFSNSPPMRMTRTGGVQGKAGLGSTNLKDGYEGQFARFLVDVVKHFQDNPDPAKRIKFTRISPLNEPQWEWNGENGQEGSRWANKDIIAMAYALDKELTRQGMDTKVLTPESGAMQSFYRPVSLMTNKYDTLFGKYFELLCEAPGLADRLDHIVGGHSYVGDPIRAFVPIRKKFRKAMDKYPDWKYWQTEYCILRGTYDVSGSGRDLTMDTAISITRVMHGDLTMANASSWSWWRAMSPANFKDGLLYTDKHNPEDPESIIESKMMWGFGHFSRFLRPGAVRVDLKGGDDVEGVMASAWHSAGDKDLVLTFINVEVEAREIDLRVAGSDGTPKTYQPYLTTDAKGDDIRPLSIHNSDDKLVLPPKSILTLVSR